MYKIPENFDATSLKDKIINQVTYGINFIALFFDEGFIQIEGRFHFNNGKSRYDCNDLYPVQNDLGLLVLLEKSITKVVINDNRDDIILFFEKGMFLKLIGDKEYESYKISINDIEILV